MAIIKPFAGAVESCPMIITPENLTPTTAVACGVQTKRAQNAAPVTSGYVIEVGPSQGMVFTSNGKVVQGVTTPGYYEISSADAPAMFGIQRIFYLNAKEIPAVRFGTQTPLQYMDKSCNAKLSFRCFGEYSIRIIDPLKLCNGLFPNGLSRLDFSETTPLTNQLKGNFLHALQSAVEKLSAEGRDISETVEDSGLITEYIAAELEPVWLQKYGLRLTAAKLGSLNYEAASLAMLNAKNEQPVIQPAMAAPELTAEPAPAEAPAAVAETPAESAPAESAPAEEAPAAAAQPQSNVWKCTACGTENTHKFCTECGNARPQEAPAEWTCTCGQINNSHFCGACGTQKQ